MQPPPPPLSSSIRTPKPATSKNSHLHINRKTSVIKQVNYWSEITTDTLKTGTWVSKYPWNLRNFKKALTGPQEHTNNWGPANARQTYLTYLNLNYKHAPSHPPYTRPCTRGTMEQLVPQFPEMRCIRSTPLNKRTTQGSREYGAILITSTRSYHSYRKT